MSDDHPLKPYTINTTGADMTLELLSNKIDAGDIEVPEFQRGHVWPLSKASKLVESFLLGLPVPQIFLYQEPNAHKLLVVDGQQRLMAIHHFFKGVYKGREFRLTGLNSQWDGKRFEDIGDADKRRLKNVTLRSTIFEQVDPSDDTSIFEVFERLNTGGMLLTAQEVRNAVIGGDLNLLTKTLNQVSSWRLLNNKKTEDMRLRDVELVLRVLALESSFEIYKKPLNAFLNDFLSSHKVLSSQEKETMTSRFTRTSDLIKDKIGINAFKLKKTVNAALADAVFVGVCRNLDHLTDNLGEAYATLLNNPEFIESIEQHTADNDKVNTRIILAIQAFRR